MPINQIANERPGRLREMLAMALVGGAVACSVFWSHVFFGPMLLSAMGVPVLAWVLPFLFPLALCLVAFSIYAITRWKKGEGLHRQSKRWDTLFSKHTLMMASYGTAFALALSCAAKISTAGLAMGALWVPIVTIVAVMMLSQLVHRLWHRWYYQRLSQVAEKNVAYRDARASVSMLVVGAMFHLTAYLSMTMAAPSVVALTGVTAMAWVMPILCPLALTALIAFSYHVYYQQQFNKGGGLRSGHRLSVIINQPHFSGMVILGALMPFAMMAAKMLFPSLLAYSSSVGVSALIACVLPITLVLGVIALSYAVYKALELVRNEQIDRTIGVHNSGQVTSLAVGASPNLHMAESDNSLLEDSIMKPGPDEPRVAEVQLWNLQLG